MDIGTILKRVKLPVQSMMIGTCTVQEYQSVKNEKTHVTRQELVTVYTDQPCKLSYSKAPTTTDGDSPVKLLAVKLFLPSELVIRAGSVLTVTQAGRTQTFKASGEPAVYTNHQEIELVNADEKA